MNYDCVIVLANLMDARGNLNGESAARMDVAIDAFAGGEASLIVTCGWDYRSDSTQSVADAMRDYGLQRGVPGGCILSEPRSRDTVGDAVFTKTGYAALNQWRRILVATSEYHLPRAQEIFSFVYGPDILVDMRGSPPPSSEELRRSERASTEAFRATFAGISPGDDPAIVERIMTRHPYYNGTADPKAHGK